ncbi:DUF6081 family protein [Streptomyces sp. NPDC013157]|uniref:DUF6081 family protein n=1 Tax=Streptomyces sp. NPDC013157 TaxID=3364861 RepID=UPI00367F8722
MTVQTGTPRRVHFVDDFAHGLDHTGPGASWRLRDTHIGAGGDGVVGRGEDGVVIVPRSVHPGTGEPAFTPSEGPEPPDAFLRWTAYLETTASTGFAGFDVSPERTLTVEAELAVRAYGTWGAPASGAAADPAGDVGRGAGALMTFDRETGMVFDFCLTGSAVYALYERLPRAGRDERAFSVAVPLCDVRPGRPHHCALTHDPAAGTVRWVVDGRHTLTVGDLGHQQFDGAFVLWELPGEERAAAPRQLAVGLTTMAASVHGQGIRLGVRRVAVHSTSR